MGVDFLARCAKSFKRSWSRGQTELASPTLFDELPEFQERTVCATPLLGCRFLEGEEYVLEIDVNGLSMFDQQHPVGIIPSVPAVVLAQIQETGSGIVIGKIEAVHISGRADVTIS